MKESNEFLNDISGNPVYLHAEYSIDGTPFFSNEYCNALVQVRKGRKYFDLPVKLNLHSHEIYYRLPDGKEMQAVTPIESITFGKCAGNDKITRFVTGFPVIDQQNSNSFYQVLDTGNIQLLRYWKVVVKDEKPYNSATTTRIFEKIPVYYFYQKDSEMMQQIKGNYFVRKMFPGKYLLIEKFMDEQQIRYKKEEDLINLVAFCNSIIQ